MRVHPVNGHTITLDEYGQYPPTYQTAILHTLNRADRERLWHQQLQRYSGPASRLAPKQKAFIDSVNADLGTILSGPAKDSAFAAAFYKSALPLFGKEHAATIFGRLGAIDHALLDVQDLPAEGGTPLAKASILGSIYGVRGFVGSLMSSILPKRFAPHAIEAIWQVPSCDCSQTSDFCGQTGPDYCGPDTGVCDFSGAIDCGLFTDFECDGYCTGLQ